MPVVSVQTYFDRRAARYLRLPKSSFWNRIKENEKRVLIDLLEGEATASVLELGAGAGYYTRALSQLAPRRLVAVDFSAAMLEGNLFATEKVLADIEDLPARISQQTYDLILCAGAVEFVENPLRLIRNLSALQNPGGIFLAFFPCRGLRTRGYELFHRWHGIQIHRFSPREISALAIPNGYRPEKIIPVFPYNYAVKFIRMV